MRQPALGAAGNVGVDDPLGAGPVELLGDQAELGIGLGGIAGFGRFPDFLALRLQSRRGGPVLRAALEALAMAFLGAGGGGHVWLSDCRKDVYGQFTNQALSQMEGSLSSGLRRHPALTFPALPL